MGSSDSALNRIVSLKFTLTYNKVMAVFILFLLCAITGDIGSEQYTFTSYYPAPSGVYNRIRATQYMKIGSPSIRVGDISNLGPGTRGAYAESGNLVLDSANGKIRIGASLTSNTNLNVCKWVEYNLSAGETSCFTAGGGNWTVIGVADSSFQLVTQQIKARSAGSAVYDITPTVSLFPETGKMLCCRLESE